mgnify:CR=1 FL=1
MSEPIVLFNIDGEEVVMHSPKVVEGLLEKGELFETPPTVVVEESPPEKGKPATNKK